ncbi:hypothetical protein [Aeromicrobium sp. 179-A 4D2 NHS]|uniref:hypothetical protein n=1 Tax=Aeromicrobium sp. 179-A 4D2 NHS TaxID=3142375 RepID=UPI0039A22262
MSLKFTEYRPRDDRRFDVIEVTANNIAEVVAYVNQCDDRGWEYASGDTTAYRKGTDMAALDVGDLLVLRKDGAVAHVYEPHRMDIFKKYYERA